MNVLIIGDIVGKGGRTTAARLIPLLRQEFACEFCIVNGENSAGGAGLTKSCVQPLAASGADVITTGDHVWDRREFVGQIATYPYVLRPANFSGRQPGRGFGVFTTAAGEKIAVINLVGRVFMKTLADNPYVAADRILETVSRETKLIFVDMHAEATSEKLALGWYLDGRVTAVFGTHTHVPTADERILPNGTAYISDVGMVGGRNSILGRDGAAVVQAFVTGLPAKFTVVETDIQLNGAVVQCDPKSGMAMSIDRIVRAGAAN